MDFLDRYIVVKRNASTNFIIYWIRLVNRNLFLVSLVGTIVMSYFVFWHLNEFGPIAIVAFICLFLYCLFYCIYALGHLFFPSKYEGYKYLSRFGDPHNVANEIEKEFRERNLRIGSAIFTKSWFLQASLTDVNVLMLGEIIWAYAKLTKTSVNFVPTGTEKNVVIHHKIREQPIEIRCSDSKLKALLYHLSARLPWIILGYSDELAGSWESNRPKFLENVSEKQRQFIETYKKEIRF